MSYYLGLSWLPARESEGSVERLRIEARRILGLLDPGGEIKRESGGRPYFADRHADFSVSHSRDMAAVAVLSAPDGEAERIPKTGCDIQYADPRKARASISRRFFHACEQEYIDSGSADERYLRFYRLWVLKETWIKLKGLSVFEMEKAPAFRVEGKAREHDSVEMSAGTAFVSQEFFLWELASRSGERYTLAAARERGPADKNTAREAPEIRWLSRERLSLSTLWAEAAEIKPASSSGRL